MFNYFPVFPTATTQQLFAELRQFRMRRLSGPHVDGVHPVHRLLLHFFFSGIHGNVLDNSELARTIRIVGWRNFSEYSKKFLYLPCGKAEFHNKKFPFFMVIFCIALRILSVGGTSISVPCKGLNP